MDELDELEQEMLDEEIGEVEGGALPSVPTEAPVKGKKAEGDLNSSA